MTEPVNIKEIVEYIEECAPEADEVCLEYCKKDNCIKIYNGSLSEITEEIVGKVEAVFNKTDYDYSVTSKDALLGMVRI